MKFDPKRLSRWLPQKEIQLPGVTSLLTNANAKILIVGAAVFEFYELQSWIPPLKRKTGDVDLSIGLVQNNDEYKKAKEFLINQKYTPDKDHPYRYHSPKKIPGGYTYIDLLAHPSGSEVNKQMVANTIGVGKDFSFNGFQFAELHSFPLIKNVDFPNPFGLMALKREGYLDDPVRRQKDFADILELIDGLIERGTHFDMDILWKKLSHREEAKTLKSMISYAAQPDHVGAWEIENIRNELVHRNFDSGYIDGTLIQRLKDFRDILV